MSFCDQMAAAIDGARTLTRLDHLSRLIWQGLAAGAVADDDAQALAERLHACRSILRGDLKPVGLVGLPPADLPSSRPGGSKRLLDALSPLPGAATSPPAVRCRRAWPASSQSASWRCCALSGTRSASTATVLGAWTRSRHGPGCVAGWFKMRFARPPGLGL